MSEAEYRVVGHKKDWPCPKCEAASFCKDCGVCSACGHCQEPLPFASLRKEVGLA